MKQLNQQGRKQNGRFPSSRWNMQGYILNCSRLWKYDVLVALVSQLKGTLMSEPPRNKGRDGG